MINLSEREPHDEKSPEQTIAAVIREWEDDWHAAGFSNTLRLMHELADALTAVSAERDAAQRKARMIPKRLRADRDRLHKAITEARKLNDRAQRDPDIWEDMDRILRAALDKEGNDDE